MEARGGSKADKLAAEGYRAMEALGRGMLASLALYGSRMIVYMSMLKLRS